MTKIKLTIVVLFLAFMNAINAQTPLIFEWMEVSPVDTGDYDFIYKDVVNFNAEEVLTYYGAFMPNPDFPETECLFYIDNTGKICTFPGAKNFLAVYSVVNDHNGDILFGTDNGLCKLSTSGLQMQFGTTGYRVKLIYPSVTGGIIYFTEEDPVNPDFSNITKMMYASPEGGITQLDEKKALINGYSEFGDSVGFASYSVQEGHIPEEPEYFFALDLDSMHYIPGFKPTNDVYYFGGYGESVIAYGKYFIRVSKIGASNGALVSWDGSQWTEKEFEHFGSFDAGGKLNVIDGVLYTGPLKINPDMSQEAVPVIGDEMVWSDLEWFNNTWYLSSPGLSDLAVGPVTTSGDVFFQSETGYLPGCLARITASTGITDPADNEFQFFPNPASEVVNIEGITPIECISLIDMSGRIVLSALKTEVINVSDVPSGMYFLSFSTDEKIFNAPIIIEH